ncbi:MAG: translation initiation factor IF-2 [Thermodesulfobacteriota bacterium]
MPMKVFELAEEYQIDPKTLLNHLRELGVFVSSHISILDDDEVAKVRGTISHIQKRQKMSEQRVKSTVIRRRPVRQVTEEAAAIVEGPPVEEPPSPGPAPQEQPPQPEDSQPQAAAAHPEPEPQVPPVVDTRPPEVERPPEKPRKRKKEREERPAIVIRRPAVAPEPPPQERVLEVEAQAPPPPSESEQPVQPPVEPQEPLVASAQVQEEAVPKEPEPPAEPPKPAPGKPPRQQPLRRETAMEPAKVLHRPKPELVRGVSAAAPTPPTPVRVDRPLVPLEHEVWGKAKKKSIKSFEVVTQERPGRGRAKKKEVIQLRAELEERERGLPFGPRKRKEREHKRTEVTVPKAIKRKIKVMESITVGELAKRMGVKSSEVIKKLLAMGVIATVNQMLDPDEAALVASEFGYEVERVLSRAEELLEEAASQETEGNLKPRPPVVTVMGHVDHGKTSLLDAIRQTHVTEQEVGGITQHIGAYQVEVNGQLITFLDTPGHEAFTSLRARGAQVTDVVVLVVAADDGVMNQTREAIDHARAAGVPIIVAVNKIDKPNADPDRVRQELANLGLVPEAWGGDTIFCDVSAKKRINIEGLLENILIQSEVLELRANPDRPARGVVIEARLDKRRGPLATVLIQEGTLRVNDAFVAGMFSGKVRMMLDHLGRRLEEAGPSTPVEVVGASGVPAAGERFWVVADEKEARDIELFRREKMRREGMTQTGRVALDRLKDQMEAGEVKELAVVLKGDVQGSIETLRETLSRMGGEKIKINVLHASVGGITENDVNLASASNAIIIGFNVRPEPRAQALAEEQGVDIRVYNIIYELMEDVEKALVGMLEPTRRETLLGRGDVVQIFRISKVGTVAGTIVKQGRISKGARARLLRDNVVVYDGRIGTLKRYQEDVRDVLEGQDCGIHLENFNDVKVGDVIEAYEVEEVAAEL